MYRSVALALSTVTFEYVVDPDRKVLNFTGSAPKAASAEARQNNSKILMALS
jgi:hypothetical protein